MNKRIYTLLLLVFVMVTLSAVSAADVQNNNQTLASDSGSDIVAVSNDDSNDLKISNDDEIQQISDSDGKTGSNKLGTNDKDIKYTEGKTKVRLDGVPRSVEEVEGSGSFTLDVIGTDSHAGTPGVNVKLTVDEATILTSASNMIGVATFDLSSLEAGNYNGVLVVDDENYQSDPVNIQITINERPKTTASFDELSDVTVEEGSGSLSFKVINPDSYDGFSGVNVKLTVGETVLYSVSNSEGDVTFDLSSITEGTYNAVVVVDDDKYKSNSETVKITVNERPKTIVSFDDLSDVTVEEGSGSLSFKVIDPEAYDGISGVNVKLTVDEATDLTSVSNSEGYVTFDLSSLVEGTYNAVAVVDDDDYKSESATVQITVNARPKTIVSFDDLSDATVEEGSGSLSFKVIDPDAYVGISGVNVKLTIGEDTVLTSVSNSEGDVTFDLSSLSQGNYTAVAVVDDDDYKSESETVKITVKNPKTPTTINVEKTSITLNVLDSDNAKATLTPVDAGNLTYTSSDEKVVKIDKNGKITAVGEGNATITVSFAGNDKYEAAENKIIAVTVNKIDTELTASDVTATYNDGKELVITLKDSNGKPLANTPVSVDLNGAKTYTTDKNGQVKVKVSTLNPNTYTAKITFSGNENYLGSDATANVVVKKATPKITASNKNFKTTTKTKKYTITLKDNAGKAIANAEVTLKVNGKTYKATTNSKGKATFKITKLSKKGTFKAVITYKGNKYYNKVNKKVSIKVISAWKTISKGSKLKSTVKEIQRALKSNGYYLTANGHYLKVDGTYSKYTVKAVKQFQKAKGLKVTGKVDEKTAKKLGII